MAIDELKSYIGKTEIVVDRITPAPLRALAATLDLADLDPKRGSPIPPCWHWLFFCSPSRQSEIEDDGHPRRGGFLPPVALPRRMWAASQIECLRPIRVGEAITKTSLISDIQSKEGRTGRLVFVKIRHEFKDQRGLALTEDQDIVYREMSTRPEIATTPGAPAGHDWSRQIKPNVVLLFRFSALTFNAHRIHYDRPYATQAEGYPGLVVHGPLLATLLLDLLHRNLPDAKVSRFAFRALKPTFDLAPFKICGSRSADGHSAHLWVEHSDGALAMDATATLRGV